ncbi:hypothetical protein P3G55_20700 [Leptospira sp. 96542]|nr:hypothetical protein [Leptospira sp. 96542]
MQSKLVPQLDLLGFFVGMSTADESPLEPGVWLIPAGAIDVPAPDVPEGQRARWQGGAWAFEPIPVPEPDPEPEMPPVVDPGE